MACLMFQNQKVTHSVSVWVSDKVTYWAVGWTAKKNHFPWYTFDLNLCLSVVLKTDGSEFFQIPEHNKEKSRVDAADFMNLFL